VRAVVDGEGQVTAVELVTTVTVNVDVRVTADAPENALSHFEMLFDGTLGVDNVKGPVTVWRESGQ
jgi:hypothetical protein